ncbi:MAG: hypothetical protein B7733_04790 [Myxococcales bacterium FL481]|nr:MAG: hypothetical protein B7733_04790 [Myxococcales bacterium FL481]
MVGIRRAIALLILGFFGTQFSITAWLGPDELMACYTGLGLVYLLAFFGVAAQWFWARWFAMGVGHFGALPLLLVFQVGPEPLLLLFGGVHLLVTVLLMGEGMASSYERSEKVQERWNFQEESLVLLRRGIKSAGTTLPFLILYTLAPRSEWMQLGTLALGLVGLVGLLRARVWGVLALGVAGLGALLDGLGVFGEPIVGYLQLQTDGSPMVLYGQIGLLAGGLLLIPAVFAPACIRFLRRRA